MSHRRCLLHESVRPAYTGIFSNVRCTCLNAGSKQGHPPPDASPGTA